MAALGASSNWQLGPFVRPSHAQPIIRPSGDLFHFPGTDAPQEWESGNTFNPAAAVRDGKVILLYRAENDPGKGVGQHLSSIGYASSDDGVHFRKSAAPVVYLDQSNRKYEDPGGCEDPRVVKSPSGQYILTYTGYDRKTARLCIASSPDLKHWTKHGPAFAGTPFLNTWSKSGSIVCQVNHGQMTAVKIHGRYWMYWGEEPIHWATSDDLIHWTPGTDSSGKLLNLLDRRPGKFDSDLVEPGPPAVLTKAGIVFLYNGKNAAKNGDPALAAGAYSAGQVLLDPHVPSKVLQRTDHPFLWPQEPFELTGQYKAGTVFIEGLVPFKGKWRLYYGTADSFVGVAEAPIQAGQ